MNEEAIKATAEIRLTGTDAGIVGLRSDGLESTFTLEMPYNQA